MKYLVTGGAGFIGSNLVDALLEDGHEVVCLDNFSTGKWENLNQAARSDAFNLIEGYILDLDICKTACEGVDYVFHQAALGSVALSIEDPIYTNAVNIGGFLNMLTAARDAEVSRFIYASSAATYGNSENLPQVEVQIGAPLSPYAITKYANELYANNFADMYGLQTIGLRYFNVFGRRQDPKGAYASVIPKFIQLFISHESPVINGDGSFSRDFVYVDDIVQMNLLAAGTKHQKAINEVYNVGSGVSTSLNELAAALKEVLPTYDPEIDSVDIKYGFERKGDIPHSLSDISKAQSLLNYIPRYSFREGIQKAAEWYYYYLSMNNSN